MPQHLCVQSDNTTAQAKNSQVGQLLATLVAMDNFETCTLNFLQVGHTHEDIDLTFGILLTDVLRRFRVQHPEELANMIEAVMGRHASSRGEECLCTVLARVRDYKAWLSDEGVHIHNCWVSRSGISAPHSFTYKRRDGLSDRETQAPPGQGGGHPIDVFCVAKQRMHSLHPNGPPTLVLPRQSFDALHSMWPTAGEAPSLFTPSRVTELLALADRLEGLSEDWGPNFSYFRAADCLRQLANYGVAPPAPTPGWLGRPPALPALGAADTGNVYFGHLPDMYWRMLVRFRH